MYNQSYKTKSIEGLYLQIQNQYDVGFDLLIMERCAHLLQPLMLDGREVTGMADESSP